MRNALLVGVLACCLALTLDPSAARLPCSGMDGARARTLHDPVVLTSDDGSRMDRAAALPREVMPERGAGIGPGRILAVLIEGRGSPPATPGWSPAARGAVQTRQDERRAPQIARNLSAAIAAVALTLLALACFELWSSGKALRRRVRIQTAVVQAMTSLAACRAEEIEDRLDLLLALLGRAVEVDRAFLITFDHPRVERLWCAPGTAAPAGWPEARRRAASAMAASPGRSFRLRVGFSEMPSDVASRLRADRVDALSYAKLLRDGDVRGVMGFERSSPLRKGHNRDGIVLSIVADIVTAALHRRDDHRRQRELEGKLRRAERLEAIGTFTSGIAHNFNNMLSVIAGQAEMAEKELAPESTASGHVERIAEAAERARDVVREILDFGRLDPRDVQTIDVSSVLSECVAQLRLMDDGGQRLITARLSAAWICANREQIRHVFLNVLQNALQASASDKSVAVSLEVTSTTARRLSHGSIGGGTFARLTVADEGRGMDPGQQARMFQPFFTTREGGTGLGLATAHGTVVGLGGAFDVRSAPGEGTAVEIWLPADSPGRAIQAIGSTILLLGRDRQEISRDEDFLAALGFEPVGFTDAGAALAAVEADPRRFDLAVVDRDAVDRDGGFIPEVRRLLPDGTPVVLSLPEAGAKDVDPEAIDGIAAILKKPWQPAAALVSLTEALRHEPPAGR